MEQKTKTVVINLFHEDHKIVKAIRQTIHLLELAIKTLASTIELQPATKRKNIKKAIHDQLSKTIDKHFT